MRRVLERLEQKCCPQGLHVMLEELQWMGERSMTYEKLFHAVRTELRATHPRIQRVAEGVYWFAGTDIPPGWSLFGDWRTLPCFYRKYPPAISWDDLDLPENVLPPPQAAARQSEVPKHRLAGHALAKGHLMTPSGSTRASCS
jgi:hypothetical protein